MSAPTPEDWPDFRECTPACNTLLDGHLADLYVAMRTGGLDHFLFHASPCPDFETFRKCVRSPDVWFYGAWSRETGSPLGMALLERFEGKTARLHFTLFRGEGFRKGIRTGKAFLTTLFRETDLSCLLALTPVRFRHAWQYGLALGFERLGSIPDACTLFDRQSGRSRTAAGMLLILNRPENGNI